MTSILITLCVLLLLAYLFDISSSLTKIPSVILLLLLGWMVRQATHFLELKIPDLNPLLPLLGTIGLILIVLDGSLELELNRDKIGLIKKSTWVAVIPLVVLALLLAFAFQLAGHVTYKTALVNAIPFCVISSAIAIPSVRNLSDQEKEFIVYDSSLSDILGVLFFNFIALNELITLASAFHFVFQILLIVIISFGSVLGLSFLLGRITHHVTYTPIILLVILIYAVSKELHLPSLIFILVFGLFLGNLNLVKRFKLIELFRTEKLDKEVAKFKDITTEATFLIRALFFILFGFLMDVSEILNIKTLPWSFGIVIAIGIVRWAILKVFNLHRSATIWVAPRGLITILLFLSIAKDQAIPLVNKSLIIQTIILSILVMMFGLMRDKTSEKVKDQPDNL
jgi:potassium/hydrogen antiporter